MTINPKFSQNDNQSKNNNNKKKSNQKYLLFKQYQNPRDPRSHPNRYQRIQIPDTIPVEQDEQRESRKKGRPPDAPMGNGSPLEKDERRPAGTPSTIKF